MKSPEKVQAPIWMLPPDSSLCGNSSWRLPVRERLRNLTFSVVHLHAMPLKPPARDLCRTGASPSTSECSYVCHQHADVSRLALSRSAGRTCAARKPGGSRDLKLTAFAGGAAGAWVLPRVRADLVLLVAPRAGGREGDAGVIGRIPGGLRSRA